MEFPEAKNPVISVEELYSGQKIYVVDYDEPEIIKFMEVRKVYKDKNYIEVHYNGYNELNLEVYSIPYRLVSASHIFLSEKDAKNYSKECEKYWNNWCKMRSCKDSGYGYVFP